MKYEFAGTPNGKIKGKTVELKQQGAKPVHVFKNVPFAKPPVGKLRFMPPEPAEPWEGIRDGITAGNLPMYPTAYDAMIESLFPIPDPFSSKPVLSEDCLHLSVYTPNIERGSEKLPVMVYFYGGGFSSGSERFYDATVLAAMNDVVVVVPNYRVNVFGFLSLGSKSVCPGNAGLLDQQMALKWIQGNIEFFGGDKDNVTIFGQSAGSCSVELQIVSPLARGLFHKAVSHSGQSTLIGVFRSEEEMKKSNKKFFKYLKIDEKDDDCKILEALQKIPADELIDALMNLAMENVNFQAFIDGHVFPKPLKDLLEDAKLAKIPYIIGCNNTEGAGLLSNMTSPNFLKGITEEELKANPFMMVTEEGFEKCKKFYIKDEKDEKRFSKLISDYIGDSMYVSRAIQSATHYSVANVPIYVYYGCFQLKMYHDVKYGAEVSQKPEWCYCDHGDDIFMTFGTPFSPYPMLKGAKFTKEEEEISIKFMTYLTNFAKTGNPNKGKKVEIEWPKYKPKGGHLVVDTKFSVGNNLKEKAVDFWTNVMPAYMTEWKVNDE